MADARLDDLDRCLHGRHSNDDCIECPDGVSTGNLFLMGTDSVEVEFREGVPWLRIGTDLRGEGIWVCPDKSAPRPTPPGYPQQAIDVNDWIGPPAQREPSDG